MVTAMEARSALGEYYILRFLPDLATGEFQNVGVVVFSESTESLLLRVPEEPSDFRKLDPSGRRLFADSLDQFLAVVADSNGLHSIQPGLFQKTCDDSDRVRIEEYKRGVRAPLALSGPHNCTSGAPIELIEMLYGTLIRPPAARLPHVTRVDYRVRGRLEDAGLFSRDRIHFNAVVSTPIGDQRVKMGYRSVRGQIVVHPVNFASGQAGVEATRAYTFADLVNKFRDSDDFPAHTIAAFTLNGHGEVPMGFKLLASGHEKLINLDAEEQYELENLWEGQGRLTILPGGCLETVVEELLDKVHVRDTFQL